MGWEPAQLQLSCVWEGKLQEPKQQPVTSARSVAGKHVPAEPEKYLDKWGGHREAAGWLTMMHQKREEQKSMSTRLCQEEHSRRREAD